MPVIKVFLYTEQDNAVIRDYNNSPVITLKYGVPADIVFQSLAKVQYQTTRIESFFD